MDLPIPVPPRTGAPGRILAAIGVLVLLTALGTAGYVILESMSVIDGLYMTVITISTVGFEEVAPLSPQGRLFTIVLITTGVGTALYIATIVAEFVVGGQLRQILGRTAMKQKVHDMHDHVIVCGFGRFGQIVAEELRQNGASVVVIEVDPARESDLQRSEFPYVLGSALADEVLADAGIARARAIVVATASDSDNVFITLSAREKNPEARIHARGESEAGLRRLRLAGAHQVVSAYQMGGMRMATSILRPAVVDFLEISRPRYGEEVDLEEIRVGAGSKMDGKPIEEVERLARRLRVIALQRGAERIRIVPSADTPVLAGDHLVVIGERASLELLAGLAE